LARRACPICHGDVRVATLPVTVQRPGRVVFRLQVPAWRCVECGYDDIEETDREQAIAALEKNSEPGDDIVFTVDE
jgi:YgiT-type zinc finger domain-containing protein